MHKQLARWVLASLFSLLVVAVLGTLMRYKIAFSFPWFDQRNLQHAHSHFAFAGWISQSLMVLFVYWLFEKGNREAFQQYFWLLLGNLLCAFGMLFSFSWQGYGPVSITFSTTSVLISYLFAWVYYRDLNVWFRSAPEAKWLKASLAFSILSSFGTFALAWMMASHHLEQRAYLSSVYFYLHFQYNGWFFFACMGLFLAKLTQSIPDFRLPGYFFPTFVVVCIQTYFLSVLWIKLSPVLYGLTVVSALVQVVLWFYFLAMLIKLQVFKRLNYTGFWQFVFWIIALCVSAKVLLQLGSVIPEVSRLAFGFRQIVIAYLHLILLAIISVFILAFSIHATFPASGLKNRRGILLFLAGVYLNEVVLGIQGIASFTYTPIPFANEVLFGLAVLMVSGLSMAVFSFRKEMTDRP